MKSIASLLLSLADGPPDPPLAGGPSHGVKATYNTATINDVNAVLQNRFSPSSRAHFSSIVETEPYEPPE